MDDTDILLNPAALEALKHAQLASLSKRHGLKTSVKRSVMVERLREFAVNTGISLNTIHDTRSSPLYPIEVDHSIDGNSTPLPSPSDTDDEETNQIASDSNTIDRGDRPRDTACGPSDVWEVLSNSGASLLSLDKRPALANSGSVSSWKSARNGECLGDFGVDGANTGPSRSTSSSMRSLASKATSLSRRASRHLLPRTTSTTSQMDVQPEAAECIEEVQVSVPPSPASTVGIPRRHSTLSILEQPSTIRLVSPPPPESSGDNAELETGNLPMCGSARHATCLNERRSMAPLRSTQGADSSFAAMALSRRSMPALPNSASGSISKICPPLPPTASISSAPSIPGSFSPLPPTPKQFVFGTKRDAGITRTEFSAAAEEVLAQMNARLPSNASKLSHELLKGKKVEVGSLVSANREVGAPGWRLSASGSSSRNDRFAVAHEKEFARMQSIGQFRKGKSTPSGSMKHSAPMTKSLTQPVKRKLEPQSSSELDLGDSSRIQADSETGRDTKRSRLSISSTLLGALRGGTRSLANLLGDVEETPTDAELKKLKELTEQRRSSLIRGKGKGLSSRFGFLRNLRKQTPVTKPVVTSSTITTSASTHFPAPTMPRKTSVFAPRDPPQPRKRFDLQESLRRSQTSTHRDQSAKLSQNYKAQPSTYGSRSSSAATILSTVSTNQSRPKVPDFGPAGRLAPPTRNTLGLPKSSSLSSSVSMKKQSQADMIRQARPAPPPPAHNQRKPSHSTAPGLTRSSTLLAPTASSLARMQATVKPPLARPLPVPPMPATPRFAPTSQPFGTASSREHLLFESNFNLPKPAPSTISHKSSTRMIKSPTKSRMRAQASGLSAVKSKGNLRGEVELQQRRAEIKARQERLAEERGLRALLGEIPGRDVEMS